jgi:class 3 adenylate cyclase/tetratricopeptide (TPR) repeat protein
VECQRCRSRYEGSAPLCIECAALLAYQVIPVGTGNRSSNNIPDLLRMSKDAIASSSTYSNKSELGERKEVSVFFADIKGSMELIDERDPEQAQSILDPALALMIDSVHLYEGTVCQVMGDGIMALFGAPMAQEDHAIRACHAALHLQKEIEKYANDLRARLGVDVQVRLGLSSGEVVVRGIITDVRLEYTAVGQTAHLAARMEQLARPGTILLAQSTAIAAGGLVDLKPLGPVPVKGLPKSIPVYELLSARHIQTHVGMALARHGGLTRFVGRDAEISQAENILERVAEARGQLLALMGEPGIGKSRLAHEVMQSRATIGWITLEGRAVSYGAKIAYLPIASLLKSYFSIDTRDSVADVRHKVRTGVTSIGEDNPDVVAAILWLLDIQEENQGSSEWIELHPAVRRLRTIDAIKRFLLKLSNARPLILLIEDSHWIDTESQAVIDALVDMLPYARILLLVTYRIEYEHSWTGRDFYTQIRIGPLSHSVLEEFVTDLLGRDSSLISLRKKLIEHTEGNPFFLEESIRSLADSHVLIGERGAYRLADSVDHLTIPASVKSVLAARIDRLSREEKKLLQAAAVVGKDVSVEVLALAVEEAGDEVESALKALQKSEFLVEIKTSPREFTFKHALTHDVAYAGLIQERRKVLHAATLNAVERLYQDRLAEHLEVLARHAVSGEIWPKAVNYLRQSGTAAAMRSDYRGATLWHRAALDCLKHIRPDQETLALGIDIRFEVYNALLALGDHAPIFEVLTEGERLAEALGDKRRLARVHGYLAMSMWWVGDYARAIELGLHAASAAREMERTGLEGIALVALGWAYYAQGRFNEADESLSRVLELAKHEPDRFAGRRGSPPLSVVALAWMASLKAEQGEFEIGLSFASEAVRKAEDTGHPWSRAAAYFGMGSLLISQMNTTAAIEVLARGLRVCENNDIVAWRTTMVWYLGYAYALEGELAAGVQLLEQAVNKAAADHCFAKHSIRLGWLAEAHLLAGNESRATELAQQALSLALKYHEVPAQAHIQRILGDIAAARPSQELFDAVGFYKQSLAIADRLSMRPLSSRCRTRLARLSALGSCS